MPLPLLIAAALGAVGLTWVLRRANLTRAARRAAYFDGVVDLFDRVSKRIDRSGFPRITGHSVALAFDLQAVPDSLTFRKLPALWVMLSLPEPVPVAATLDIMTRPSGHETFSHFNTLPDSLPCPDFLPVGTGVRSDNASLVPQPDVLARHAGIFTDERVKELLISPNGLRIVMLADEADRGRYLLFRDAELGRTAFRAGDMERLMAGLLALRSDLMMRESA